MISAQTDSVKQQAAAHWNRRAAHFDKDFGHSIRTPAERATWDRILDLSLPRCVERLGRFRGCKIVILQLHIDGRLCITCLEEIMDLILIIVVVLLVFGGGGYWGYSRWR
jgi:hypothetical protein